MKKYICTAMALLMAASLFVGCGCTNRNVSDHPGGRITDPTTATNPMPTMTEPTTRPSTAPTTEGTMPSTDAAHGTDSTTGILPDASQPMPGTTEAAPGETSGGARSGSRHSVRP